MTVQTLRLSALVTAGGVLVAGAAFPAVAALRVGAEPSAGVVLDAAGQALLPSLALAAVVYLAGAHRLAAWSALLGGLLTLGLGVALYASALGPDARAVAPRLAVEVVPLRQLAAVAVTAWVVWIARRSRDGR